ncbi:hypothetical protein ACVINU_000735 [Bradyrhizobium diazoefficiens]
MLCAHDHAQKPNVTFPSTPRRFAAPTVREKYLIGALFVLALAALLAPTLPPPARGTSRISSTPAPGSACPTPATY